ncbi:phBC6A51 family helix-turn-helix protein [Brevibacillus borstelensis]|uniref:phBC6A51 family helix-turn-helix protein n=1 Tax=Brevibacillus borstelensis TaxID=45462 RepID=UPI0035C8E73F
MARRRKRGRPPRTELTDAQRQAIALLVYGWRHERNRERIAKACGVSRMALWKWEHRNKLFQRELEQEQTRARNEWRRRLHKKLSARVIMSDFKLMEQVLRA